MGRKKQPWAVGDIFTVPLLDGRLCVGQVIGREAEALNSATVALFSRSCDRRDEAVSMDRTEQSAFSVLFATRDLLDSGHWSVVGKGPVLIPRSMFPFESTRPTGWVGARVIGSANINEFVNAFFGLAPWDDWNDPCYLDGLLVSPDRKPRHLIYKAARSRP